MKINKLLSINFYSAPNNFAPLAKIRWLVVNPEASCRARTRTSGTQGSKFGDHK